MPQKSVATPAVNTKRQQSPQSIQQATTPQDTAEVLSFPLSLYEAPARPKRLVRKKVRLHVIALRTFSFALIGVLLAGGIFAWQGVGKAQNVFRGTGTVAALSGDGPSIERLKGEGDGRVNILLLGVGGKNHDGGELTDTIMVMSVDPVNNTAELVSVPRDLWVLTGPSSTHKKINSVFESAVQAYSAENGVKKDKKASMDSGFLAIDKVIGTVLGVKIDYHAVVDFTAFERAIDAVGGVTVTVKTQLNDPMLAWENGNNAQLFMPGQQVLSGKRALLYTRSRYTTSDFSRGDRQKEVIVALKNKVTTAKNMANPLKLRELATSFSDNAYSDLSPEGAVRLLSILRQVGSQNITQISLTDGPKPFLAPAMLDGQSVVLPVAGQGNYADIQDFMRSKLHDGYIKKEAAPVYIVAKDGESARKTAENLQGYGYIVAGTGTLNAPPTTGTLIDLSGDSAVYTKNYLKARYSEVGSEKLPSEISVPVGTKFVILVP